MLSLVSAFGYREVHLAGHNFGSLVASWCAVARPDVFRSVVLMSAPFGGTAALPFDTADAAPAQAGAPPADIDDELANLDPPRWHYRRFYATRGANDDLWRAPAGGARAASRGPARGDAQGGRAAASATRATLPVQAAAVYGVAPFVRSVEEFLQSLMPRQPVAKTKKAKTATPPAVRPRPVAKRVWASLEREPAEVIAEAMLEAERHDPERVKRWVVLVDGAETQFDLVEAGAAAYGVDVTVVLDIIHVVEYVWKAAHVFHREGSPELACWAWTRVRDILEGKASRGGVDAACGNRRRLVARHPQAGGYVRRLPAEVRAVSALRPLPRGGVSHRHRRDRRGVPAPGARPDGVDRRPLTAGRRRGGAEAPGAASQRRLRCVLGLPRSARVRAEPRPAICWRDSPAGHRAAPTALLTPPSTGQVALTVPFAEPHGPSPEPPTKKSRTHRQSGHGRHVGCAGSGDGTVHRGHGERRGEHAHRLRLEERRARICRRILAAHGHRRVEPTAATRQLPCVGLAGAAAGDLGRDPGFRTRPVGHQGLQVSGPCRVQSGAQGDLQEPLCHECMLLCGRPAGYAHMRWVVIGIPGLDAQCAAHAAACFSDVMHFELQKPPTSPEGEPTAHRFSYLVYPATLNRVFEVLKPVGGQVALTVTEVKSHKRRAPIIVQGAWRTVAHYVMVVTKFSSRHFRRLEASHLAKLSVLGLYSEPATCRASSPPVPG